MKTFKEYLKEGSGIRAGYPANARDHHFEATKAKARFDRKGYHHHMIVHHKLHAEHSSDKVSKLRHTGEAHRHQLELEKVRD